MIGRVPPPLVALPPLRVCGAMIGIIVVLLALHLAAMAVLLGAVPDGFVGAGALVEHFDMNQRRTVPAWYSAGALLFCGALAGLIAWGAPRGRGSYRIHWVVLAVLLAFLAVDKLFAAHRVPFRLLTAAAGLPPAPRVLAVAVAAAGLAAGAVFVWRFLQHLPGRTRTAFIVAAAVFLAGAVGFEVAGARLATPDAPTSAYVAVSTVEEVLEKLAVVVLAYGLATQLRYGAAYGLPRSPR